MRSQAFETLRSGRSFEFDENLIPIFDQLELDSDESTFLERIWNHGDISQEDFLAIVGSLRGDRTLIDKRLRDPEVEKKIWVVRVPEEIGYEQKYAWTIANHDNRMISLQKQAPEMYLEARKDELLKCPGDYRQDAPPPINWLLPIKSSKMPQPPGRDALRDEFYIFQVPKSSKDEYIDDFDQALVLNSKLIEKGLELQKERMQKVFNLNDDYTRKLVDYHGANSIELAAAHLELHNSGHFLGPIPFGDSKRDHKSYDFIEELRACLCGFRTAEVNGLEGDKLETLGLQILCTRVLLHGYNAWKMPNGTRNRQEVREIVVGAILWQRLVDDNSLRVENDGIELVPGGFRVSINRMLSDIHNAEKYALSHSEEKFDDILSDISVGFLKATFDGKEYKPELLKIYEHINSI